MTGFYDKATGAATPTNDTTVNADTSFFNVAASGLRMGVAPIFNGILQPGSAHIGSVNVDNFPGQFAISNFPGLSNVAITNFPTTQRVALDFPAVQAVNVLNLTQDQQVHGSVAITNFPAVQPVSLTGDSTVRALLLAGTSHIGTVSLDAPITGSVTVTNFPANQPVTVGNFPQTQNINGTVSVGNFPTSMNVRITGSDVNLGSGGSSDSAFDGVIKNTTAKPVPVQIVGQSSFNGSLSAGTAHIGSVSLDAPVAITGTVPVSLASVPTHGVTIQNTPSVTLQGLVALAANAAVAVTSLPPVSGAVAIQNFPANQTVSGTVSVSNFPDTQTVTGSVNATIQGTPTFALANSSVSVSNFPAVQTVAGTISLSNGFDGVLANSTATIGSIQSILNTVMVAGTVTANVAFPAVQPVSLDTSTKPVNVNIVGGSTGGSGTSFNGVLANSTANIGTVSLANGSAISTTETGFGVNVESTGNIAAGATFNGATRATPQSGLQFMVRVYNSSTGGSDLTVQGSYDGTTWASIKTVGAYAGGYSTSSVDAVLPFYRVQVKAGLLLTNPNVTCWFGRYSAEVGIAMTQFGGGVVGQPNPLWITSNTNFGVTPYQGGVAVGSTNAMYVQHLASTGVQVLTTTALGTGTTFTSAVITPVQTAVALIIVTSISDQSGTLTVQGAASTAGPWFNASPATAMAAGVPTYVTLPIGFTVYRVVYLNGATTQGSFYLSINQSRVGAAN